jgi:predicted site-specific integrase-resolvase
MEPLLDLKQTCAIVNAAEPTVRAWLAEGTFITPVNEPGRKLLFRPEDLRRWMNRRQQPTPDTKEGSK